jgi:hypothetical protein
LAFTTSALAIAVRIRQIEIDHKVAGAIGSSPYVPFSSASSPMADLNA